jgi:CubicO group peptidase (beta-lactamase class C family)
MTEMGGLLPVRFRARMGRCRTFWRYAISLGVTIMDRIRRTAIFAPLLIAAAAQSAWPADAIAQRLDERSFDEFIRATLRSYSVPGAVVAVADASATVFVKGYGVRQARSPSPVDENTRFQIASLSKFVAATAIATLVDQGVVSWDVPVRQFSPDTVLAEPYATENASLRDYLAHRTGLPAYAGDLLAQLGYSPEELIRRARFLPFDHSFRAEWAYSNYGIFLGQRSAAHAAGISAPELLSKRILQPLGMLRSGPTQAELFKDDNRATAHNINGSIMPYENVDAFSGGGAIVSTGADIARWMRMLLAEGKFEGRQILAPRTVGQIFAASMVQGPGGPLQDPNNCAGLGCESYQFLGHRVIEKNGALNGVRTIVTLVPGRNIGIAVFANKQLTVFPEAVRAEFLERVLGHSGRDLQKQIRGEQDAWNTLVAIPKPPADAKPLRRALNAFTGRFVNPFYGSLNVVQEGDSLRVWIGDHNYPARLTHWSDDSFLLTFDNPDIAPGLLAFWFDTGADHASGFAGSKIADAFTIDYDRFERAG